MIIARTLLVFITFTGFPKGTGCFKDLHCSTSNVDFWHEIMYDERRLQYSWARITIKIHLIHFLYLLLSLIAPPNYERDGLGMC